MDDLSIPAPALGLTKLLAFDEKAKSFFNSYFQLGLFFEAKLRG
jgi:hypothetical protein